MSLPKWQRSINKFGITEINKEKNMIDILIIIAPISFCASMLVCFLYYWLLGQITSFEIFLHIVWGIIPITGALILFMLLWEKLGERHDRGESRVFKRKTKF